GIAGVLEEVSLDDAAIELGVIEEVIVHAVLLPRARVARGGGDGQLELGHALEQRADERSLADPGGAGDDEDVPVHHALRPDDQGAAEGLLGVTVSASRRARCADAVKARRWSSRARCGRAAGPCSPSRARTWEPPAADRRPW